MIDQPDIQLIDDQPENLQILRSMLAKRGYRVRTSINGWLALASAFETPPDLILLDIMMPQMNGYEVCQRLKTDPRTSDVPIIFLSALDSIEDKVKAYAAGGSDFIAKPFQETEVLARVAAHLALRSARKQIELQNIQLQEINHKLNLEINEHKLAVAESQEKTLALKKRSKELNAFYTIDQLVRTPDISLTDMLHRTVTLLPDSWQYPEVCCAQITLEGKQYKTGNFKKTAWSLAQDIIAAGKPVGKLEVCYLKEKPPRDEGPFLIEERNLINAIAERLGSIIERVQTDQILRKNDLQYRALVTNLNAGVVVHAPNGQILFSNTTANLMLGLTEQEIQGKDDKDPAWNFLRADGTVMPIEEYPVNQVIASGQPLQQFVIGIVKEPDAAPSWGLVNAFPEFSDQNQLHRVVVTFTNITQHKQAQNRINHLNAVLHAVRKINYLIVREKDTDRLIEQACHLLTETRGYYHAWIGLLDESKKITTVAEVAAKQNFKPMGDYVRLAQPLACVSQALAQPNAIYLAHPQGDCPGCPLADYYPQSGSMSVRLAHGGSVFGVLTVKMPASFLANDEELTLFEAVAGDIALALHNIKLAGQQRHTEETLRLLTQAIEQSPVSVVITDTTGRIQYVNPKFTRVTGYSPAEAIGQNPRILQSGEQPPSFYRTMWDTLAAGQEWRGEFHNKKKNGELYWELASIAGVKDSNGQITHYVAVKEDITQRKQLEQETLRQERLAAVGQLAAGVAHDFNNLLMTIMGNANVLQNRPDTPEPIKKRLAKIVEQGERAAQLTRQILDFSRQTVIELQPLDLRVYLNETLKFIERTIPENIQIQLDYLRDNYTINADPTQLQQIITNLAVNARDAMPRGGALYFDLSRLTLTPDETPPCSEMAPGDWISLAVTDTGTGIAPEVFPHIFEPFFTTKEIGHGTGLGLAQIYGIVMRHNGHICVNSQVGQGTTFTLYFPAVFTQVAAESDFLSALPLGRGETILLVEDDQIVLEVTQAMLKTLNYQVAIARDGVEALAVYHAQADQIALVLADAIMPTMDGFALAAALKAERPDLTILLMSGYTYDSIGAPEILQSISGYLQKPLDIHSLAQALQKAMV